MNFAPSIIITLPFFTNPSLTIFLMHEKNLVRSNVFSVWNTSTKPRIPRNARIDMRCDRLHCTDRRRNLFCGCCSLTGTLSWWKISFSSCCYGSVSAFIRCGEGDMFVRERTDDGLDWWWVNYMWMIGWWWWWRPGWVWDRVLMWGVWTIDQEVEIGVRGPMTFEQLSHVPFTTILSFKTLEPKAVRQLSAAEIERLTWLQVAVTSTESVKKWHIVALRRETFQGLTSDQIKVLPDDIFASAKDTCCPMPSKAWSRARYRTFRQRRSTRTSLERDVGFFFTSFSTKCIARLTNEQLGHALYPPTYLTWRWLWCECSWLFNVSMVYIFLSSNRISI